MKQTCSSWNLVCAGPSRAHLRKEHLIEGGAIVTVNRSLDIAASGFDVDYCAMADGPQKLWVELDLQRFWKPPMVLWISASCVSMKVTTKAGDKATVPGAPYAKIWDSVLDSCIGFRLMPHGDIPDHEKPDVRRTAFTTLCAFKNILRFKPKVIRILSMDMAGTWVEGLSEETCHTLDMERDGLDRWKHERKAMETAMNQARGEGVRVECVTPEPVEVESMDGAVVH